MTTFSILNTKQDLNEVAPIGTSLMVKVSPTEFTPEALRAFTLVKNEDIGFVGTNKLMPGTENAGELYQIMSKYDKLDSGIEVVVVDIGELEMVTGGSVKRKTLIVEVAKGELEQPSDETDVQDGAVTLTLLMKGTTMKHPKKATVMKKSMYIKQNPEDEKFAKDFYDNFSVELDAENRVIVSKFNDVSNGQDDYGLAGTADSSSKDYELAYKVLSVLDNVKVGIKNPANGTFEIELSVSEEDMHFVRTGERPMTIGELKQNKAEILGIDVERIDRIHAYLEKCGVSKKSIERIFLSYKKYPEEVTNRIPEPTVQFSDSFGGVKKSVVYLNKKKHLRYIGEKGTGKNLLITTMAWIYQRPLYEFSMNAQTDKMDLLGSPTLDAKVEDGNVIQKVQFQKQALIEAMEYGGFMNLDEVNTADPAVLVLLHSIVDDRGTIEVPSYGRVQADDNFGMILSMNVDYVGTTPLNEATRDRFTPIVFPENESIAKLLKARVPSAKKEEIALSDRVYKEMMKLVEAGRLSMDSITVRGFIDALEVLDELSLVEALTDNVVNRIEDREYRTTVAEIVDKVVG